MYKLKKSFYISTAHFLSNFKKNESNNIEIYGKCRHIHGHNDKITLYLKAETINETGMIINFNSVKDIFKKYIDDIYDHKLLNEIDSFIHIIPTAENMAKVFYDILKPYLPQLYAVEVEETNGASAIYEN